MKSFASSAEALEWARELVGRDDVLYLDTETTGVRYGIDDIVDIGIVNRHGQIVMDQLVRPSLPITGETESIHGISNRMVRTAPTLPEIWPEVRRLVAGKILVSYNADFDEQMLFGAAERRSLPPASPARWDCAMEAFAAFNGELSHHRPGFRWINLE
ncbi:MAG: 3'-5' exonuclease, partial [Chloroflexota bacterium]|nr:3'-5' exonuclease [Chloroflexota bacterium]